MKVKVTLELEVTNGNGVPKAAMKVQNQHSKN